MKRVASCLAAFLVLLLSDPCRVGYGKPRRRQIAGHEVLEVVDHRKRGLLESTTPTSIFEDKDGRFWIASYPILYVYEERSDDWAALEADFKRKVSIYNVASVSQTNDGKLWFAGSQSGLSTRILVSTVEQGKWRVADEIIDLGSLRLNLGEDLCLVFRGRAGKLWLVFSRSESSYLASYDGTAWSPPVAVPAFIMGGAFAGLEDSRGSIWLGIDSDIWRLDADSRQWIKCAKPVQLAGARRVYEDREGRIWFADLVDYIAVYERANNLWTSHRFTDHLPPSAKVPNKILGLYGLAPVLSVAAIYQDRRGQTMFGTNRGLLTFAEKEKKWNFFTPDNSGLPGASVKTIFEDAAGRIWIATERGIVILEP